MNLKVGQKLWYVPRQARSGNAYEIEVQSVGRKWAYCSHNTKIDIQSGDEDGGEYSSPDRAWTSKEEWQNHIDLQVAFQSLRNDLKLSPDLTLSDILKAREILHLSR